MIKSRDLVLVRTTLADDVGGSCLLSITINNKTGEFKEGSCKIDLLVV